MKVIFIFAIFLSIYFLPGIGKGSDTKLVVQRPASDTTVRCDTMSIDRIHDTAHKILVYTTSTDFVEDDKMPVMIKLYNTLLFDTVAKRDTAFANRFSDVFYHQFLKKNADRFQLTVGSKMTLFSARFKLFTGYCPIERCDDIYVFW